MWLGYYTGYNITIINYMNSLCNAVVKLAIAKGFAMLIFKNEHFLSSTKVVFTDSTSYYMGMAKPIAIANITTDILCKSRLMFLYKYFFPGWT